MGGHDRCEFCMKFAAIFVPDFPVEAVVRAEPELRGQGVAVVEGTPPLLNVVACNQRAREAGVEIGMTKVEAEGRFAGHAAVSGGDPAAQIGAPQSRTRPSGVEPGWQVRRRSPAQEMAAHAALIDCGCAFSPRVEDNSATPDTVVLDLDGLERLFGPPAKIARDLARRASELGLEANVAVAGNAEAALHAARGFAGVTVIPPGEEAERLGALPVEVLLDSNGGSALAGGGNRGMDVLDTLARWGVRTFLALAALPETAVRQRLGELGVRLQKLARGEGTRPLVPAEPPMIFEETAELEYSVTLLEALSFLLNHLLEQLCARMNARALATQEVRLILGTERSADESETVEFPVSKGSRGFRVPRQGTQNLERPRAQSETDPEGHKCGTQEYTLRLPVPMLGAKVFLKLLQLELRAKPPGAPVSRIFLKAEPVRPRFTQGGLFLPTAPEPEKLEVMLARINAVVSQTPAAGREEVPRPAVTGHGDNPSGPDPRNSATQLVDCPIAESPDELRVGAVELLDTHRPDAFRIKKFVPPERASDSLSPVSANPLPGTPAGKTNLKTGRCDVAGSPTAVRRFRPPRPVRVEVRVGRPDGIYDLRFVIFASGRSNSRSLRSQDTEQNQSVREGTPRARQVENHNAQIESVLWSAGPWRESGEWWTCEPWSREVWDVAVSWEDAILVCRLFHDVARDEWFVEAVYD
jgi:protein ImuB